MKNHLTISVQHPDITMFRCEVNGKTVKHKLIKDNYYFSAPDDSQVNVYFEPWKIEPIVRFNHHMVNYALAEINQYNHMLEFSVDVNYLERYFANQIKYKKEFLNITDDNKSLLMDQFVGVEVDYSEIEQLIDNKLNE